jgi:hypothetical protein
MEFEKYKVVKPFDSQTDLLNVWRRQISVYYSPVF